MLLVMNGVCKIKIVFKYLKKPKPPMWIKPQQSFVETGVRTRSSLSMCWWPKERNFSVLCQSLNVKVLYKSNLICELIGVGKPGQQ